MKHSRRLYAVVAMLLLASTGACRNDSAKTTKPKVTGPAAAVQTTVYHGLGQVKSLNAKRPSIEIEHEEIPNLMPAMTMEFYVSENSLLEGIKPGDRIKFTLENGVGGLKITEIKKL